MKLAETRCHVILAARSVEKLYKTAEKINTAGGNATVIHTDVSDPVSIDNLIKKTSDIGFVNIIVNNAGLGVFNRIENSRLEDWDSQMAVNLRGAYLVSKGYIPQMQQNKTGTIVFINSTAGIKGYPYSTAYVASKFGLRGFSMSLREELRDYNIKVVSVHPGAVDTPFWDDIKADFPREEMMSAEEIAHTVVHTIRQNQIATVEEIVLRRTAGDF